MDYQKNLVLRVRDEALKGRLITRLVARYSYWLGGFYTEELRSGAVREGFVLRTPCGRSELMASKTTLSPVSFNKYGVNMRALDGLAVRSLADARKDGKITLMDELGPITLGSEKLAAAVLDSLASPAPCLATFRGNAGKFEGTFIRMENTRVFDLSGPGLPELQTLLEGWMEFWIEKVSCEKN